jgi:hypothetical protein
MGTLRTRGVAVSFLVTGAGLVLVVGSLLVAPKGGDNRSPANSGGLVPTAAESTASASAAATPVLTVVLPPQVVGQTATLLPNGLVLVAGGEYPVPVYHPGLEFTPPPSGAPFESAGLFNPTTEACSPAGSMLAGRTDATATLLSDGRVLIEGGYSQQGVDDRGPLGPLASAEIYDVTSGKFSPTGSMSVARGAGQTATLLHDGRVLVVGGFDGKASTASAELYDPKTGTFGPAGSMATVRWNDSATLLTDGRVLIAGGDSRSGNSDTDQLASAELFDPTTGAFSPTGSMTAARAGHTATLLPDGRVLVAGGFTNRPPNAMGSMSLASTELYDPQTRTFSATGFSLAEPRIGHVAIMLPGGRVLIVGGDAGMSVGYPTAEIFDASKGASTLVSSNVSVRGNPATMLLPNGKVLFVAYGLAITFDPATNSFGRSTPLDC